MFRIAQMRVRDRVGVCPYPGPTMVGCGSSRSSSTGGPLSCPPDDGAVVMALSRRLAFWRFCQ